MKNQIIYAFLILGSILFFSNCDTTEKAEECANKFFSCLIKDDFKTAADLLLYKPFDHTSKVETLKTLGTNLEFGKLVSVERYYGFKTEIRNGISTVQIPCRLIYETGSVNYYLTLVDNGTKFKIKSFQ